MTPADILRELAKEADKGICKIVSVKFERYPKNATAMKVTFVVYDALKGRVKS